MTRRLVALAAIALGLCVAAPAQAIPPFDTLWTVQPGIDPPGVNARNCKPTAAHPVPVVLVHGTGMGRTISWNVIGPKLALDGYCVFALDYGNRGTQKVERSAHEISAFIDEVRALTGAPRVSVVA